MQWPAVSRIAGVIRLCRDAVITVLSTVLSAGVGGKGGNGGDVTQQSYTTQTGNGNSGKTDRLPLLLTPIRASLSGVKVGVESQSPASATPPCAQRTQRSRRMPMAATAETA